MKKKNKKPPVGVMPKHLWEEQRLIDIADAICRYVYNYKKVPIEWIVEFEELNNKKKK